MQDLDYSEIPAPGARCVTCGKELAEVLKHPSVLEVDQKGQPERRDICPECWEKITEGEFVSFWLTQREPPKPDTRRTRQQQREALRQLFERFVASGDQRLRVHIYVMAHLLMKHRLLVWEGSERDEDGVERIVFRHPVTDDRLLVEEVPLDDEQLIAVKREIDTALAVTDVEDSESDKNKREDADSSAESNAEPRRGDPGES